METDLDLLDTPLAPKTFTPITTPVEAVRMPTFRQPGSWVLADRIEAWCGGRMIEIISEPDSEGVRLVDGFAMELPTMDSLTAEPGDWIVKHTDGKFFRCPHEAFIAGYAEVSA